MANQSIEDELTRFIIDEFAAEVGVKEIRPDDSLIGNGILDSLSLLQLIVFIEERYGIKVEDEEVTPNNFQNINHIVTFLRTKQGAAKSAEPGR